MFTVILIMTSGIIVGYLLRRFNLKAISKIISLLIFMLLFVLGSQVGSNSAIMENLSTIGMDALIITIGALLGSLILVKLVYKKFIQK